MNFLRLEGWEGNGIIDYGFGTRDKQRKIVLKQDWRGQTIQGKTENFPLVAARQSHGDEVLLFHGRPQETEEIWFKEGDALLTQIPGFALGIFTADCLPILLVDPVAGVAGIVHAGWRGTAKGIAYKAVEKMKEIFHCLNKNVEAVLGPCIGPCCLEVDSLVKESFSTGKLLWEGISSSTGRGKWSLDLRLANSDHLQRAGVKKQNIHSLKLCTSCRRDTFFSYRAEGGTQGRQLTFIALRKNK